MTRLYRDYIGTDGKKRRDEVDRDPEIVTREIVGKRLHVGNLYRAGEDKDRVYRLTGVVDGGLSRFEEVCPVPHCVAPVTHRSLHDIPSGEPKGAAS